MLELLFKKAGGIFYLCEGKWLQPRRVRFISSLDLNSSFWEVTCLILNDYCVEIVSFLSLLPALSTFGGFLALWSFAFSPFALCLVFTS